MGEIAEAAVCGIIGKAVLFLVILPMGVLFWDIWHILLQELSMNCAKAKNRGRE